MKSGRGWKSYALAGRVVAVVARAAEVAAGFDRIGRRACRGGQDGA